MATPKRQDRDLPGEISAPSTTSSTSRHDDDQRSLESQETDSSSDSDSQDSGRVQCWRTLIICVLIAIVFYFGLYLVISHFEGETSEGGKY